MRTTIALLLCLTLCACGKKGALFLPEDAENQQESAENEKKD